MSQGGNFIQNNLDDSDGETPVENQQPINNYAVGLASANMYPGGVSYGLLNDTPFQEQNNGPNMAAPFFHVEPERPTGYLDRETDTEDECNDEPCPFNYEFKEPLGYTDVDPKKLQKLKQEYDEAGKEILPDDFFKKVDEVLGKGKYAPGEHPFEIFVRNNNEQKKKGGGVKIDLNDSRPLADLTGHGDRRGYNDNISLNYEDHHHGRNDGPPSEGAPQQRFTSTGYGIEDVGGSGGQVFPAVGSNLSSRGGNDPMSAFLGGLGGGMGSGQNHPVSQGQNLGASNSNQLAAMLQSLSFEQGLGRGGDGGGGGGGGVGVGGGLNNQDEQFLSLLQGLRGQGSGGAGGAVKGQNPAGPLLSGQRGEAPGSGQLGGLAQFLTGSGGSRNDGSSPSVHTNPDGGRGGEASRVGGQGSGQDPIQRFAGGERGGGFPNPFAMSQMFGGGGGVGQDGGQTVTGGNKLPSGLGSGSTAGISGPQSQATQLQAMMQMLGGAGGSPASGAAGGGQPLTSTEDFKKLLTDLKSKQEEEKQNPPARRGINLDSNPDELLAAVTGDDPGRRSSQNMGQGVGQTGGPNPGQAGSQGLGQVGGQGHGLNLGQAGLAGRHTSQEQQVSSLMHLLQNQNQGQGQGPGQIPQGQGLGLAQPGLGRGQIPQGQQMQGLMQLMQNQGQGQSHIPMGGGLGGLGSMGRGLGPMGRGLGPMGGGLGLMAGGGLSGQLPGRGRGRGGGRMGDINDLVQQEVVRAIQNPDSRADGPCTVIIVDCSGSVQGEPLKDAVQFISDFIDGLEEVQFENGLEENVALITVGANNISIPQHLTNNYQKVRNVINSFYAEGPTHLDLAFLFVLAVLADSERAIYNTNEHYVLPRVFVLTDGRPTNDVDVPGQVMNPEDQNLLVMKNTTTECAHTVNEKMLAKITCVPIGECDVAFLEMLAGVTGGQVRCLGDAHALSRNFLHHFIAGKMKAAGVKSNDLASVLKAAEELTVADDADVDSILTIIKEDEPNIAEWKSKRQEDYAGAIGGMGRGVPNLPGGLGMGGGGMGGLLGAGMGGAGMGGPGMAALLGQGMGGPGMGGAGMGGTGAGMGGAGMASLMSQAMGGAGMGGAGAGMGGAGMASLMSQAMGGAGMGGAGAGMGGAGMASLLSQAMGGAGMGGAGMGGFPALYGMGGGGSDNKGQLKIVGVEGGKGGKEIDNKLMGKGHLDIKHAFEGHNKKLVPEQVLPVLESSFEQKGQASAECNVSDFAENVQHGAACGQNKDASLAGDDISKDEIIQQLINASKTQGPEPEVSNVLTEERIRQMISGNGDEPLSNPGDIPQVLQDLGIYKEPDEEELKEIYGLDSGQQKEKLNKRDGVGMGVGPQPDFLRLLKGLNAQSVSRGQDADPRNINPLSQAYRGVFAGNINFNMMGGQHQGDTIY